VDPVVPEFPETATGLLTAEEEALPVRPEFVALDCAVEFPVLPDVAMGVALTFTPPPAPPLAEPTATLEPPMAADEPIVPNEKLRAGPPAPATAADRSPPLPPCPPTATTVVPLAAVPVLPDAELLVALAPELALLWALPTATAGPVSPERPELPDWAPPPTATAVPRMAELFALGLDVAAPVDPVVPELPDTATGLLTAADDALPVVPLFVALDCDVDAPEFPDVATGLTLTVEPPPEPPLAEFTATLEPPVADELPTVPADTLVAVPPVPAAAADVPPPPPLPPAAITVVWFTAAPVEPEAEFDTEPAPEEAELLADPDEIAVPVDPEGPEPPVVAWAHEGDDCRSRTAKTAAAEARTAQPSRLKDRMVAVFMRITSLPTCRPRPKPQTPGFDTSSLVVTRSPCEVASRAECAEGVYLSAGCL
jgi:hypothetical protein